MRKLISLIAFGFFGISITLAQGQSISPKDSLQVFLQTAPADTNRINALHAIGDLWQNENLDSATTYYEQAFALSKKKNFQKGIGDYYLKMAYQIGYLQGRPTRGLDLARAYLLFAEGQHDEYLIGKALFSHAIIHQGTQQLDSAIYYYEQSLLHFTAAKSEEQLSVLYGNLATLYDRQELPDQALAFAQKARTLYEEEKDTFGLINMYNTLGSIYAYLEDNEQVLANYRAAVRLTQSFEHPLLHVVSVYNLGNSLDPLSSPDSSLAYQMEAFQLADSLGYLRHRANSAMGIALTYGKLDKWAEAEHYYQLAIQDTAQVALPITKQSALLRLYFDILVHRGDFETATGLFPQYIDLQEEEERREKAEASLAFDYRLKKAEQEKTLLAKELEINRQRVWITGLLAGLTLLLFGVVFLVLFQRKKQQAKAQTILALQKEQELIATRSKLEGQLRERSRISTEIHDDLGASLTTIALLVQVVQKKWADKAPPQLAKIASTATETVDRLNEIIWSLNTRNDTLHSLVAYIRQFASRFLQDTDITLECLIELAAEDQAVSGTARRNLYLVTKEALHNAVKHAQADRIVLCVKLKDNLQISIQDNGIGFNPNQHTTAGNGLLNMQKRMQEIGGHLQIKNHQGTHIYFTYGNKN